MFITLVITLSGKYCQFAPSFSKLDFKSPNVTASYSFLITIILDLYQALDVMQNWSTYRGQDFVILEKLEPLLQIQK